METGTLFRVAKREDIFRIIDNSEENCSGCACFGKERLCKKMPYCYGKLPIKFQKLTFNEVRQVKKTKEFVDYFEN